MSHFTGTGERNSHFIEQEAEHASREQRREEAERHEAYIRTPELDEVRQRIAEYRRREANLKEWQDYIGNVRNHAVNCEVEDVRTLLDSAYACLERRIKDIDAEWSALDRERQTLERVE